MEHAHKVLAAAALLVKRHSEKANPNYVRKNGIIARRHRQDPSAGVGCE